MSEFEDKLNSILSSPEAMDQIMALANSLGGDGKTTESPQVQEPADGEQERPAADLSALLSALGGGGAEGEQGGPSLGKIDPAMLSGMVELLREYNRSDDRKTALLLALRPFLKEERWARVDRAVQIARLSRVIRAAFRMLGGGEAGV